ncbi:MAG: hypothetical protein F6K14_01830 [Symploca sp. SIO2C1]|nr:hypothetical protein [Symploca sp. SIO2C1]
MIDGDYGKVIKSLPSNRSKRKGKTATLARLDGKEEWRFMLMPVEISRSRDADYSPSNTMGNLPEQQWQRTRGWTVKINNLPVDGLYWNKSITEYVNAIASYQVPKSGKREKEQEPSPPVLLLQWGKRIILSPCIMTSFRCIEKNWFPDGDLATASLSFTLMEIPISQIART